MTVRVSMLLISRASPDVLPFSLCNKKRLAIRHMNRPLSNDTIDSVLRHREVGRAKELSAPPRRVSNLIPVLRRIIFAPSALLAIFTTAFSVCAAKKQHVFACVNERVKYCLMFVLHIKFEINDSILFTMSFWPAYKNYIFKFLTMKRSP